MCVSVHVCEMGEGNGGQVGPGQPGIFKGLLSQASCWDDRLWPPSPGNPLLRDSEPVTTGPHVTPSSRPPFVQLWIVSLGSLASATLSRITGLYWFLSSTITWITYHSGTWKFILSLFLDIIIIFILVCFKFICVCLHLSSLTCMEVPAETGWGYYII